MYRILFLGEGPSDEAITVHIEKIARECGLQIQITSPNAEMLPSRDRTVAGKLRAVMRIGGFYSAVVVHRDGDRDGRGSRIAEIRAAVEQVLPDTPYAPVIPIRMTEAWLVLDEQLIRDVAGNPNGRVPLKLPSPPEAERNADPKALLKELLATASGLSGRKRKSFQARFDSHRQLILERLDPNGRVKLTRSWQDFHADLTGLFSALR